MSREQQLEAALRAIDEAVKCHIDGHDLLDKLHPRNTLDIKRRVDGRETWHEGDWLSGLRTAIQRARVVLAGDEWREPRAVLPAQTDAAVARGLTSQHMPATRGRSALVCIK